MFRAAIHVDDVPERVGSGYPEPFASLMGDRRKRALGDVFGLSQFGVNVVTLGPGGRSALRHFHSHEDELVMVLEGELTLVTNRGEQVVGPGMFVGFRANVADAHHFVNRSDKPARYLEIGSRIKADVAFYPDDDMCWVPDGKGGWAAARKDGTLY